MPAFETSTCSSSTARLDLRREAAHRASDARSATSAAQAVVPRRAPGSRRPPARRRPASRPCTSTVGPGRGDALRQRAAEAVGRPGDEGRGGGGRAHDETVRAPVPLRRQRMNWFTKSAPSPTFA